MEICLCCKSRVKAKSDKFLNEGKRLADNQKEYRALEGSCTLDTGRLPSNLRPVCKEAQAL